MIKVHSTRILKYDKEIASNFDSRRQKRLLECNNEKIRNEIFTSGLLIGLIKPKNSEISYTETGKPYFESSNLHFNVTHSDIKALIAYTDESEVGIDYEATTRRVNEDIARRLVNEDDKIKDLLRLFTIKESISKLLGLGLGLDFRNIHLTPEYNTRPGIDNVKAKKNLEYYRFVIKASDNQITATGYVASFIINDGYVAISSNKSINYLMINL